MSTCNWDIYVDFGFPRLVVVAWAQDGLPDTCALNREDHRPVIVCNTFLVALPIAKTIAVLQ